MKVFQLSHRAMSSMREATEKVRHKKIVAVETEIYSPRINNEIYYRGYPVRDLTRKCNFMEVALLLIKGHIPSESERTDFCNAIRRGAADVTPLVYKVQSLLPAEAHAADVITASMALLNANSGDPKAEVLEQILGECLAIISHWRLGITADELHTSDMIVDFLAQSICGKPLKDLGEDAKNLMNAIAILYMEHGLTSASYAARVCISEKGTVYSAIINALATHRSCVPMFAWREFDGIFGVSETEKDAIIAKFKQDRCLPKQFRDFVLPDRDPRTDILLDYCPSGSLDQILEMQQGFDRKCHFRFDVFVFHLIRQLCNDNSDIAIKAMQSALLMPRIVGWISHIAEQQKIKRRIEHIAAYIGPYPKQLITKTNT